MYITMNNDFDLGNPFSISDVKMKTNHLMTWEYETINHLFHPRYQENVVHHHWLNLYISLSL